MTSKVIINYLRILPQGKATRQNNLGQLDKQGINEQLKRARTTEARQLLIDGFSRKEIAEKMGITYQTISRYCRGLQNNGNAMFTKPGVKIAAVIDPAVFSELDSRNGTLSEVIRDAINFALAKGF